MHDYYFDNSICRLKVRKLNNEILNVRFYYFFSFCVDRSPAPLFPLLPLKVTFFGQFTSIYKKKKYTVPKYRVWKNYRRGLRETGSNGKKIEELGHFKWLI